MENCSATGNPDPVLGQEDELSALLVFLSDRFFCRYDLNGKRRVNFVNYHYFAFQLEPNLALLFLPLGGRSLLLCSYE